MPVTPIIGVRISWHMAARNVDLARLASSAACARLDGLLLGLLARGDVGLDRRGHLVERAGHLLELGDRRGPRRARA